MLLSPSLLPYLGLSAVLLSMIKMHDPLHIQTANAYIRSKYVLNRSESILYRIEQSRQKNGKLSLVWNVNPSPSCEQALQLVVFTPWLLSNYNDRHAHKRLYMVLPIYSKIQVLPDITICRLMKTINQQYDLNSLLKNEHAKGYYWIL